MRADATRNRAHVVEAARQVFKEQGLDAPLDDVAKRAGVGPGTLYRHFPTRADLHNAVMQAWIATVQDQARVAVARPGEPRSRLIAWFGDYVNLLTTHRGAAVVITAGIGDPASPFATKCEAYLEATTLVLMTLDAEGALRRGIDPTEVCRIVGGIAAVADRAQLSDSQVAPLLAVVADGLLTPAAS